MPGFWSWILPKEKRFTAAFGDQMGSVSKIINLFESLRRSPGKISEILKEFEALEKEADEKAGIILKLVKKTFSTPFDREDLWALSHNIDDIVDLAEDAVRELSYNKNSISDSAIEQFLVMIPIAVISLQKAVMTIFDCGQKNTEKILSLCEYVKQQERPADKVINNAIPCFVNEVQVKIKETLYLATELKEKKCLDQEAVIGVFKKIVEGENKIFDFILRRTALETLEKTMDKCADVAKFIERLVLAR